MFNFDAGNNTPRRAVLRGMAGAALAGVLMTSDNAAGAAAQNNRPARYVSSDGNDANPGTKERPWKTLQRAADAARPGDVVLIRPGVYRERVTLNVPNVAFDALLAAPSGVAGPREAGVIIDAEGLEGRAGIDTNGQNGVRLRGLYVRNTMPRGVGIFVRGSKDVHVLQCLTENTQDSGIMVDFSERVEVTDCEVTKACQGGGEESVSIKRSKHVDVNRNHVHHTGHEGIDVKEGASHVRVRSNRVHHVDRQGLYADAWDKPSTDIRFENNHVHDCLFGAGACSETGGLLSDVWFVNNVIHDLKGPGLFVADWGDPKAKHPIKGLHFINNTVVRCGPGGANGGWGGGVWFENADAEDVVVRNNLLSRNHGGQLIVQNGKRPKSWTVENNLIEGSGEAYGENNVTGDPLLGEDLRLKPGSPAIDRGAAKGAPKTDADGKPRGAKPDIGAYEFAGKGD